jgi:hypothetical protein
VRTLELAVDLLGQARAHAQKPTPRALTEIGAIPSHN